MLFLIIAQQYLPCPCYAYGHKTATAKMLVKSQSLFGQIWAFMGFSMAC